MESRASGSICKWNYDMTRIPKRDEKHAENKLYLTDSCPVLHVWDNFKVGFWRLHKHTWSFSVVVLLMRNHLFLLQLL